MLSSISDKYSKYNPILIDGVFIEFDSSDVVRHKLVRQIIEAYANGNNKEKK